MILETPIVPLTEETRSLQSKCIDLYRQLAVSPPHYTQVDAWMVCAHLTAGHKGEIPAHC